MDNFVITIARGYGTGGKQVAIKLAELFGIECYESQILTLASQMSGIDESEFQQIDERLREKNLRYMLKKIPLVKNPHAVLSRFVSDSLLFEYQARIIRDLAEKESCIIVGKCADYVLKDYQNVVKVYIEAPREFTRERIMRIQGVPAETADHLIEKTDAYRAAYYEYYTEGNYWTNPVNYDITLNSSTMGLDGCVEMICQCLKVKLGIDIPVRQ